MLTFADIDQLNRIATYYCCECAPNSKRELIQSILNTIGSSSLFEEQVKSLALCDLRFINTLLFDARRYFNLEELVAIARQCMDKKHKESTVTSRDMIVHFMKRGWLFKGSTIQTTNLYQIPLDIKARCRVFIKKYVTSGLSYTGIPAVYRDEHHLLAEDLHVFLDFVAQNHIPLNQQGMMYKRYQQQIMECLHVQEPLITRGGWRFGYGRSFRDYPDRYSLLYDYAYDLGWIKEQHGFLLLSELGKSRLDLNVEESMIHLFRFWLKRYKSAIPNVVSIVYWIYHCAQKWCTWDSLFQQIGVFVQPFYYDTSQQVFEKRIIKMLLHLGVIRIGEKLGTKVIELTGWGIKVCEQCIVPQN